MAQSNLEAKFAGLWAALYPDIELSPEYKFSSDRGWRFDFAHEPSRVAIEVEGGTFSNGRHNRGDGFIKDAEKYSWANHFGWMVYRLPGPLIDQGRVSIGKTREWWLTVEIHRIAARMKERMKRGEAI